MFRSLILASIVLIAVSVSISAQRTRRPAARPTPTPLSVNPVISSAKLQVSNQLHNVNVFVDKMGPIAVAVEEADRAAKSGKLRKEAADANELNKRKLIAAIRGLREGIVTLETDFRTKPLLAQYLSRIQGVTELCAESEDSAIAGRFVAAKDPLRQVAMKLNETMAVLPGPTPAGSSSVPVPRQTTSIPIATSSSRQTPVVQSSSNAKREVAMGMSADEVLKSTWGAPQNKRVSSTSNGKTEVWVYSGNRTIYFFNGKVTQIVR